jgi:hypothetical protein
VIKTNLKVSLFIMSLPFAAIFLASFTQRVAR